VKGETVLGMGLGHFRRTQGDNSVTGRGNTVMNVGGKREAFTWVTFDVGTEEKLLGGGPHFCPFGRFSSIGSQRGWPKFGTRSKEISEDRL